MHIFKRGCEPLYEFGPEEVDKKRRKKLAQIGRIVKGGLVSLQIVCGG